MSWPFTQIKQMVLLFSAILILALLLIFISFRSKTNTVQDMGKPRSVLGPIGPLKRFMTRPKVPRVNIPRVMRLSVWRDHSDGSMDSSCFSCSTGIRLEDSWECGHIISHSHGGETSESNMKPLCRACNRSMGPTHMYEYMCVKEYTSNLNLATVSYFKVIQNKTRRVLKSAEAIYGDRSFKGISRCLDPRKVCHEIRSLLLDHLLSIDIVGLESVFSNSLLWKRSLN